ncbi:MAG: Ig-like domain-containing protein, partial [Acidobacteriota bacterium]
VATDTLGHSGESSVTVRLDPAGPAIRLTTPVDQERYSETSAPQIEITGEAWAIDGAQISLNGGVLDPNDLAWGDPGDDGRRYVEFSALLPLPTVDGPFGLIARVTDPEDRTAQARRLLSKDSVAPEVEEMIPADGAVGVDPNALMLVLFSEPVAHGSLEAADGLTLERLSSAEVVVGSLTVAGNAVGLAPGAGLAAGEQYRLRAGLGIRDLAGHPLAEAVSVIFTVAEGVTSDAPQVDPLPAVVCVDVLEVTGTAATFAQVKVRSGSLTFTGFADADGAYTVSLPMASNGFHLLHVFTLDEASGTTSPETSLTIRRDCSGPTVQDAVFDRDSGAITVRFSEALDLSTFRATGADGDAVEITDAEDPAAPAQPATVSGAGASTYVLQLSTDPAAFWRDRPVRLTIAAPAADLEGNAMTTVFEKVFFPGGGGGLSGGFLFGEAWDDTTGRPLQSASARLFDSGDALPGAFDPALAAEPLLDVVTEGRGRYTMAGQVPAGRYAIVVEKAGFTRAVRRLGIEPSKGVVPFDARLTPLAASAGTLDPNAGGQLDVSGMAFAAAAASLPGVDPVDVVLTPLSGQGLPDFLPLGWTPVAAVDLRVERGGAALPESETFLAGGVELDLPLPSWHLPGDTLVAAQYDLASGSWLALAPVEVVDGAAGEALARIRPTGPGAVTVLRPDLDEATRPTLPSAAGEALAGVEAPGTAPLFDADLTLSPPVVAPSGKSRARVVARSQDGVTPWPSGLAVQAFIEEKLILAAGGGQLLEAPFVADLVLYHPRLDSQERGSNTVGSAGAVEFAVSPSPRAAQVLLEVGFENIRLYPFPEEVERGQVLGPAGGTVGRADTVELVVPEGALTGDTVAEVELLDADALAALPPVDGFTTLAAVRLGFQGQTLGRAATLRLPSPEGTPAPVAGDPRVVVAEWGEFPSDRRGDFARVVSRARRQGGGASERLIAGPDSDAGLPLDGIVREGTYLVL